MPAMPRRADRAPSEATTSGAVIELPSARVSVPLWASAEKPVTETGPISSALPSSLLSRAAINAVFGTIWA